MSRIIEVYGVGIAVEIVRRIGLLEYISATTTSGNILTTCKTVNAILRLVEIHAAGLCLQNIHREK